MITAGHWPFLLILLVIVLIIWGPGKLPELGSGMGKAIREFRKASNEVKDSVMQSTTEQPAAAPPAATTEPTPPVAATPPAPVSSVPSPVAPAAQPAPPAAQPTEHRPA
jgi:TatA/E family protein of Tat protein translocase